MLLPPLHRTPLNKGWLHTHTHTLSHPKTHVHAYKKASKNGSSYSSSVFIFSVMRFWTDRGQSRKSSLRWPSCHTTPVSAWIRCLNASAFGNGSNHRLDWYCVCQRVVLVPGVGGKVSNEFDLIFPSIATREQKPTSWYRQSQRLVRSASSVMFLLVNVTKLISCSVSLIGMMGLSSWRCCEFC